jgi:hypothetical protein
VQDFVLIISVPNNSCRFVFIEAAWIKEGVFYSKTRQYTSYSLCSVLFFVFFQWLFGRLLTMASPLFLLQSCIVPLRASLPYCAILRHPSALRRRIYCSTVLPPTLSSRIRFGILLLNVLLTCTAHCNLLAQRYVTGSVSVTNVSQTL